MVLQQEAEQPRDVAQGKVPRAVGNWCQALEGGLQQSPRELASLLCELKARGWLGREATDLRP